MRNGAANIPGWDKAAHRRTPDMPPYQYTAYASVNGGSGVLALLDRRADQIAPLRPRAIVVAHVGITEQLRQHKPGVRRTLANAAVGKHLFVGADAFATVDGSQLLGGLECAIRVGRRGPGDALRAGNVAAARGALLWVVDHMHQLA